MLLALTGPARLAHALTLNLHFKGAEKSATLVRVPQGQPVRLALRVEPGERRGQRGDCWLFAQTPAGPFSYNRFGWYSGEFRAGVLPMYKLRGRTVLKKDSLPAGEYVFTVCVDDNTDGVRDCTWRDDVTLVVE